MHARLFLVAAIVATASAAHANTCMFMNGGTLHEEVPLGCPLEIYHAADPVFSARPHADTITIMRGGQPVELPVLGAMAVRSKSVPVRFDRPSATCDTELYTENRDVDGIALTIDGLQVGDEFSATVFVDAGPPCPTLVLDPSRIGWLQCSPTIDVYQRCCEMLGPDCGMQPPAGGGCATTHGASFGALAILLGALTARRGRGGSFRRS